MWSDNEADIDLLQFHFLSETIVDLVQSPHLLPTTIGVYGDWGSGKSSLLKMVKSNLESKDGVLCLSFSSWLFENYEDAKTALMGSILESLEDYLKERETLSDEAQALLTKLLKRVNWFQLARMTGRYALPLLAGQPYMTAFAAGQDLLKFAGDKLKGDKPEFSVEELQSLVKAAPEGGESIRRNIRDFHRDFEQLLRACDLRCLVVFIDDLDRCLPDTVIETLEAIKLFLFVPGTAFVIGADERLVQYAVRQRFPELPGKEVEVGRDYLEKLIQFPFRIPPLSGPEIESYINALFARLTFPEAEDFEPVRHSIAEFKPNNLAALAFDIEQAQSVLGDKMTDQLREDMALAAQIAPVLTQGLAGNPRRAKRFLNTLLLRLNLANARGLALSRRILAKLMVLEEIKPEFFRALGTLQAACEGRSPELAILEKRYRGAEAALETAEENEPEVELPETRDDESEVSTVTLLAWEADPWMRAWLASETELGEVDLRPYFFIAHDRLSERFASQSRLGPTAERVLNRLLDAQEFTRRLGLEEAKNLSPADAVAVWEQLARRVRQSEQLGGDTLFQTTLRFVAERRDLIGQLVALLDSLPASKIPVALVPQLVPIFKGSPAETAGKGLLESWKTCGNRDLQKAANNALGRF